jgi:hypothetical protein
MTTLINMLGGGGSSIVNNYYNEVTESTGFVDPTESELSFNDGNRTFTIAPVDVSFTFWAFGNRYVKTEAESIQINDIDGLWYIYYDVNGDLGAVQSIWDLSTMVPVATILWSGGTGTVDNNKQDTKSSKFVNAYIMSVSVPGKLEDAQVCLFHVVAGSETIELDKRLPYSMIKCGTAPTVDAVFDILVNGVSKGSATIEDTLTVGTFTWNTKVTLNAGDIVKITGPATADATLEDVGITLEGIRV